MNGWGTSIVRVLVVLLLAWLHVIEVEAVSVEVPMESMRPGAQREVHSLSSGAQRRGSSATPRLMRRPHSEERFSRIASSRARKVDHLKESRNHSVSWSSSLDISPEYFVDMWPLSSQEPTTTKPKVIFANSRYGFPEMPAVPCHVPCSLTQEASALEHADAVVWNLRWMSPLKSLPAVKTKEQKWIFSFFFEAAWYEGKRACDVEESACDAGHMTNFDWTMTYSPRSDFVHDMRRMVPKALSDEAQNFAKGREHLLLWFVSNCVPERMQVFKALQASLPDNSAHIYGKCGEPSPCEGRDESDSCHQNIFAKYKFYAAFENSRCGGYVTEKFWRGFDEGMVPVVFGGSSRKDYEMLGVPPGAFLHVDDFHSVDQLASFMANIDDDKYNDFFAWRSSFQVQSNAETTQKVVCDVCAELHKSPGDQKPASYGSSLSKWWYDGECVDNRPKWS
jgi:hypothetical protein